MRLICWLELPVSMQQQGPELLPAPETTSGACLNPGQAYSCNQRPKDVVWAGDEEHVPLRVAAQLLLGEVIDVGHGLGAPGALQLPHHQYPQVGQLKQKIERRCHLRSDKACHARYAAFLWDAEQGRADLALYVLHIRQPLHKLG